MQGWVFSLCFFHHHLVFPWQPPTHLPCGSGCSSALLLLVPSPLGLRYPSVPSLAPLSSPVSWPLALLTLPLSRWLKVLGWVQIPSHFHPFPLIFSPSESFSFLPEKKFPWLSETPPPAPKARHPSFPNPGVFAFDYSTPLRFCVVPDLWLVPGTPCLGGNAGILFSRGEEAGLASARAGVLGWDIPSSALGAVWHNPDFIYWLHITWGIHT